MYSLLLERFISILLVKEEIYAGEGERERSFEREEAKRRGGGVRE